MIKKMLLTAAAAAILAGVSMTGPITAQAAMTCKDAAKAKYPKGLLQRAEYKHQCVKAWKAANGKGLLNKLKSS
jgi:hypothetical protein